MPGLDDNLIMSSKVQAVSIQFGIVQRLQSSHDQFMHQVKLVKLVCDKNKSTVNSCLKPPITDTGLSLSPVSQLSESTSGKFVSPLSSTEDNTGLIHPSLESSLNNSSVIQSPDSAIFLSPESPYSDIAITQSSDLPCSDSAISQNPVSPYSDTESIQDLTSVSESKESVINQESLHYKDSVSFLDSEPAVVEDKQNDCFSLNTGFIKSRCKGSFQKDIFSSVNGDNSVTSNGSSGNRTASLNAMNVENLISFGDSLQEHSEGFPEKYNQDQMDNSNTRETELSVSKTVQQDPLPSLEYSAMESSCNNVDFVTDNSCISNFNGKEADLIEPEEMDDVSYNNKNLSCQDDSGLGNDSNMYQSFSTDDFHVDPDSAESLFTNGKHSTTSSGSEFNQEMNEYTSNSVNICTENGHTPETEDFESWMQSEIPENQGQNNSQRKIFEDQDGSSDMKQENVDEFYCNEEQVEENVDWTSLCEESHLSPIIEENSSETVNKVEENYFLQKKENNCYGDDTTVEDNSPYPSMTKTQTGSDNENMDDENGMSEYHDFNTGNDASDRDEMNVYNSSDDQHMNVEKDTSHDQTLNDEDNTLDHEISDKEETDAHFESTSCHSDYSDEEDSFCLEEENFVTHCEIFLQCRNTADSSSEQPELKADEKTLSEIHHSTTDFTENMSDIRTRNCNLAPQCSDITEAQFNVVDEENTEIQKSGIEMQDYDFTGVNISFNEKDLVNKNGALVLTTDEHNERYTSDVPDGIKVHDAATNEFDNSSKNICVRKNYPEQDEMDSSGETETEQPQDTHQNNSTVLTALKPKPSESKYSASLDDFLQEDERNSQNIQVRHKQNMQESHLRNTQERYSQNINERNTWDIQDRNPCNTEDPQDVQEKHYKNTKLNTSAVSNNEIADRNNSLTQADPSSVLQTKHKNHKEQSSHLFVSRLKQKFEVTTSDERQRGNKKSDEQKGFSSNLKSKSMENLSSQSLNDPTSSRNQNNNSDNKMADVFETSNKTNTSTEPNNLSLSCGYSSFHKSLHDVRSTSENSLPAVSKGLPHHRSMFDIKNDDDDDLKSDDEQHTTRRFSFHQIKKLFESQKSFPSENKETAIQGVKKKTESQISTSSDPSSKEEEIVQDGETVFRTKEEKRYSDSFTNQNKFDAKQDYSTPHYLSNEQVQQHGQYNQNITNNEVSQEYYQFESSKDVTDYPTHTDEQEEGIYENEPMKRSDVVRESDTNIAEGLPAVGMAKNLLNKFAHIKDEPQEPRKKEITPPESVHGPVEYVSEPRAMVETYQGRPEAGIFENQPDYNPDVVRSGGAPEDILPEHGMARNVASKFKELEKTGGSTTKSAGKREITPDRDGGKVEFVSEPRGYVEKYEGRADSGVFENQPGHIDNVIKSGQEIEEELPEQGYAKNIASKFKQMERGVVPAPSQPRKKEMTPDRSTKVEYVSEPRGYVETYEGRAEAGVFENQPYSPTTEIVKCDQPVSEEPLPERGYAQHIAAKFRELETQAKSPPPTPVRIKEMTPPREEVNITQNSGVFESQPQVLPDVVRAEDNPEDIVPETGLAKSLVSRFKQLEAESSKPIVSAKQKREITPPKAESGVFENQPKQFVPEYNRQPESGILENKPEHKEGVIKESDPPKFEEELPERGMAKNLVSRWKQMENQGNTKVASPKPVKEFTPPREEERVKAARSPKSPKSPEVVQQEPTVFESEPGTRPDVYREADTDWMEGMPKSNTTKKMLEKFKHIQEEVNKQPPKPVSKKEEQGDSSRKSPNRIETKAKKTGFLVAVQTEKCGVCGKSVYAMERLEMNKVVYHKTCFKCSQCKSTLTPKTFAVNNGIMYCTNHYKQLFTRKGNYDEGFGREQHKKKWRSEPNLNDSEQQAT